MNFYIQQGHGKGSKISTVAAETPIGGVFLSPGDEDSGKLAETRHEASRLGLDVRLDPQSYIYSPEPSGGAKHHRSHGLELPISWHPTPKQLDGFLNAVEVANRRIGISGPIIAPTCMLDSFGSIWTPAAVSIAAAASDVWGSQNAIISVAVTESALTDWAAISRWLDAVTTIDARGFYFVVQRTNAGYPGLPWNVDSLANLLRIFYRLNAMNGYEASWGYSEGEGLLGIAAGASKMGSGWHYNLRQFNRAKWFKSEPGGSTPTPRMFVSQLWSSLKVEAEVNVIKSRDLGLDILSPIEHQCTQTSGVLGPHLQYLTAIAGKAQAVGTQGGPLDRLTFIHNQLTLALTSFKNIATAGVILDANHENRIRSFFQALEQFIEREQL